MEKVRSIREIAAVCGHGKTDRLHHLLSQAPLSAVSLQQSLQSPLARLSTNQPALLALDDPTSPAMAKPSRGWGGITTDSS